MHIASVKRKIRIQSAPDEKSGYGLKYRSFVLPFFFLFMLQLNIKKQLTIISLK